MGRHRLLNSMLSVASGQTRLLDSLLVVSIVGIASFVRLVSLPGTKSCPKGQFGGGYFVGCINCPPGSFKASAGYGLCELCPVMSFADSSGSSECTACARGEVATAGALSCTLCRPGTYASRRGVCELCGEGGWSEEGSVHCTCNKGWTREPEGHRCTRCPANTFKAARGSASCQPCPSGMVSPPASEDLMQCIPGSITSGLLLLLKGTGVIHEDSRERLWREQTTKFLAVLGQELADEATKQLSVAISNAATAAESLGHLLTKLLASIYDLFTSPSEFFDYVSQEFDSFTSKQICRNLQTMELWLSSHAEYDEWRRTARILKDLKHGLGSQQHTANEVCRNMRRSARRVLLLVHPDKFAAVHPACPPGASAQLAAAFNAEYVLLKDKCAGSE